jgi:L-fucose isomerase-like protein
MCKGLVGDVRLPFVEAYKHPGCHIGKSGSATKDVVAKSHSVVTPLNHLARRCSATSLSMPQLDGQYSRSMLDPREWTVGSDRRSRVVKIGYDVG